MCLRSFGGAPPQSHLVFIGRCCRTPSLNANGTPTHALGALLGATFKVQACTLEVCWFVCLLTSVRVVGSQLPHCSNAHRHHRGLR